MPEPWTEAEMDWSDLSPAEREEAERIRQSLVAADWLAWPARAEAKRQVLAGRGNALRQAQDEREVTGE